MSCVHLLRYWRVVHVCCVGRFCGFKELSRAQKELNSGATILDKTDSGRFVYVVRTIEFDSWPLVCICRCGSVSMDSK